MLCTFQVFLGAQAGMTLLIFSGWKSRLIRWLAWSVLTGLIGALLCLASQNDGWIPVNKNLWCEIYPTVVTIVLHGHLINALGRTWLLDARIQTETNCCLLGRCLLSWWRRAWPFSSWAPATGSSTSENGGMAPLFFTPVFLFIYFDEFKEFRIHICRLFGFNALEKIGMNGILMYLGHQGAYSLFPWHWEYGPMNTHFEKLVETLWGVSLWVLTATWLYHKKIFLAL